MDIFEVHRRIMDDYASHIRSFVSISDDMMRQRVDQHLNGDHLWPEPLLGANPAFGGSAIRIFRYHSLGDERPLL